MGKTNNPRFRLDSHFTSSGSEWTKKYKPVNIVELRPDCDDYDEDKITRQYMDKYGIQNVRGGSFTSVKLDKQSINILKRMSNGTNDKCFICGKSGHFASSCFVNEVSDLDSDSDNEIWLCKHCGKDFQEETKCNYHEKYCKSKKNEDKIRINKPKTTISNPILENFLNITNKCFRCGRTGHYATNCFATKHLKGYFLN